MEVPDRSSLNFGTGAFTTTFWINVKNSLVANTEYGIINKNSYFQSAPGWGAEISTYGAAAGQYKLEAYVTNQTAWLNTNAQVANLLVDTWYHVACYRNGTTIKIYINGALAASTTHVETGGNVDNNRSVFIGDSTYWGAANLHLPAYLDDMRLYNRASRLY